MTDTLVADPFMPAEEDDLLTKHETPPAQVKTEPARQPCPYCERTFAPGKMGGMSLARHVNAKHKQPVKPKAPSPKRPATARAAKADPERPAKVRKSAAENLSLLVSAGAQFAARTGALPLANALAFEAPAAGHALDQAVAGTIIDRKIVQPLNQGAEKWEALGAVLTLPIMVHLVSIYPALQDAFEPQIRRAAEDILVQSLPQIRKKVEKDRRVADALVELGHLDPTLAASADPVGDIVAGFFAGFAPPPEAPSAEG